MEAVEIDMKTLRMCGESSLKRYELYVATETAGSRGLLVDIYSS